MEYSTLEDLISLLTFGTKLHICVVFLGDNGNSKTRLPLYFINHTSAICEHYKESTNGLRKCFRCRNYALSKTIRGKKAFGGICANGIYEYCHPIIYNNNVAAVVFIGNIFPDEKDSKKLKKQNLNLTLMDTLQTNYSPEDCKKTANLIDCYTQLLLHEYSNISSSTFNPLIENIKNYIEVNLNYDISIKRLANNFNYNEKYLGRVFKKNTGITITEYLNSRRIEKIKPLILNSNLNITELSIKSGFNNVTYFTRMFKRYTGKTISQFRKEKN